MFKKILFFKQSSYFKLSDLEFEEEFILVWCVNEQMAVLIHEKKSTLRKRIIKKISKKKKSLIRVSFLKVFILKYFELIFELIFILFII
jgi:hypothetical protein